MSEEDFREGLPSREQIEAHYEPGKQYGHWRRKGDPRAFRLGWHNDGCWHEAVAWPPWCAVIDDFESLCSSAWQPADSSNSLLPWSVVEAGCEYRSPTDDEIRAHEANGGAWAARDTSYRLLGFRDGELYRGHALRPARPILRRNS